MFIVGEAGSSPPGHEVTATNLGQNQVSTLRGGGNMFYYEPAWPGKQTPLSALGHYYLLFLSSMEQGTERIVCRCLAKMQTDYEPYFTLINAAYCASRVS